MTQTQRDRGNELSHCLASGTLFLILPRRGGSYKENVNVARLVAVTPSGGPEDAGENWLGRPACNVFGHS